MQPSRIVLVTGASRGIGADIARRLAGPDTHVVVGYREREYRATAVAEDIRSAGGHATPLAGDITDDADATAMMKVIAERFGRLDTLILNASGALRPGVDDAGSAMRVDRDAQRRLAGLAMPLMPAGAHIVFVTSHQAHFYPNKAVPKGGAAFAAGRRAGETALYAMRSEFDRAGIRFSVVSGDSDQAFAGSVVDVAAAPNPSGIVYVGSADYLMTA